MKPRLKESIFLKIVDGTIHQVTFDDIFYIQVFGDHTVFYTQEKEYKVLCPMKRVDQKMPKRLFHRIHNSYIVNLDRIKKIEDTTVYVGSFLIPVSRSRHDTFMKRLAVLS